MMGAITYNIYGSYRDIAEMKKINNLYKILKFKSESWLSKLSNIKN